MKTSGNWFVPDVVHMCCTKPRQCRVCRLIKSDQGILKSKDGKDLVEEAEIKNRWKEYTERLCQRDGNMTETFNAVECEEPTILESEVRWALGQLTNGKAPGVDNIPIELLKAAGEEGIQVITGICQCIGLPRPGLMNGNDLSMSYYSRKEILESVQIIEQ